MNRIQILNFIEDIKLKHNKNTSAVGKIIKNLPINNEIALSKNECELGKWMIENEKQLRDVFGNIFYEKLENLHARWHIEYKNIYDIYVVKDEKKKGFLSNLISSDKKNISQMEKDKAEAYYFELRSTNDEIVDTLDSIFRRTQALKESAFMS